MSEERLIRVASAGLGHQSTAMIAACILGEPGFPKLNAAAFADTGDERKQTYIHAARFTAWCAERGLFLATVRKNDKSGSLSQSIRDRLDGNRKSASPIPVHLGGAGRALQGCTRDWKQRALDKRYRELAKACEADAVEVCIGYGVEEILRVPAPSEYGWPEGWSPRYPLIENGWDRAKSVAYIREKLGWKVIGSCCLMCPHRPAVGPGSFDEIQRTDKDEWAEVVAFDAAIRDGRKWGLRATAYLSAMRLPLPEAVAEAKRQGTFGFAGDNGECDGGPCFT